MKTLLLVQALIAIAAYIMCAFISADFNIANWDYDLRFGAGIAWGVCHVFHWIFYGMEVSNNNQ